MSDGDLTGPERCLLDAFSLALNEVPRAVEEDLRIAADLSHAEYQALSKLAGTHPGSLRLHELAERTGMSISRASRLANDLVKRGYATREAVTEDGRGLHLAISEQGLRRAVHAQASYIASVRRHVLEPLRLEGIDLVALARIISGLPS